MQEPLANCIKDGNAFNTSAFISVKLAFTDVKMWKYEKHRHAWTISLLER